MKSIRILTLLFLPILLPGLGAAQESASPELVASSIDRLLVIDPAQLAKSLQEMKSQIADWDNQTATLRNRAAELEAQAKETSEKIEALKILLEKFAMGAEVSPPQSEAMAMNAADPSAMTEMASMEAQPAEAVVSYAEHVRPIFQAKCFSCHNRDSRRSGLSLETLAQVMEGGSSGAVIIPGKPENSRLFRLISHMEEPKMPLSGEKLDAESIEKIRIWIKQGAPEKSDSEILIAEEEAAEAAPVFVAAEIPDGPPPMPEVELGLPSFDQKRPNAARAVAINPRSPLMAAAGLEQVVLYDLEKNLMLGALPFPEGEIYSLTFSLNGELLAAGGGRVGESGAAVLWKVRTGERLVEIQEGYDALLAIDVSPDHKMIATGDSDGVVKVFSTESKKLLYQCEDHTDWIHSVGFTPDGEVLASGDRAGGLILWQAATGRKVETLRGHTGAINDLDYSHDSTQLFTAGGDGNIFVWDTWAYTGVRNFRAHDGAVLSLDVSAGGQVLTTGSDRKVRLWSLDGTHQKDYGLLPDWGYQARFDEATGKVAAGAWNGDILLWNRDSGETALQVSTLPSSTNTATEGQSVADSGK